MAKENAPSRDELIAAKIPDDAGMVDVVATIDGVTDNGKTYAAGASFHMHVDLVGAHIAAGQVRLAQGADRKLADAARRAGGGE